MCELASFCRLMVPHAGPCESYAADFLWSGIAIILAPLPVSVRTDSLAERSEFELPVPVSKLSDDSVVL
jgi:hypothetical protein